MNLNLNKYLICIFLLSGCATDSKNLSDNVYQDSFLKILKTVTSNEKDVKYEDPINVEEWLFLSDYKNVKYYINISDVVVNHVTSTVAYTVLNDGRKYKKEIMKEFGYSKDFDNLMPDFVAFRSILNCKDGRSILQWKTEMDSDLKIKKKQYSLAIQDTPSIVANSIDSSICFSLSMMKL